MKKKNQIMLFSLFCLFLQSSLFSMEHIIDAFFKPLHPSYVYKDEQPMQQAEQLYRRSDQRIVFADEEKSTVEQFLQRTVHNDFFLIKLTRTLTSITLLGHIAFLLCATFADNNEVCYPEDHLCYP